MKLIGSLTSPYTRAVRMLCIELSLTFEFEETPPFKNMTPEWDKQLKQTNPLFKVPILIDDDKYLVESRVILNYLAHIYRNSPNFDGRVLSTDINSYQKQNLISVLYGVLDAAALGFMMRASYPELDAEVGYLQRSFERIKGGMEWLESSGDFDDSFEIPEILLISLLQWFEKRDLLNWRNTYPKLTALHDQFKGRQSVISTMIPEHF